MLNAYTYSCFLSKFIKVLNELLYYNPYHQFFKKKLYVLITSHHESKYKRTTPIIKALTITFKDNLDEFLFIKQIPT